MTLERGAMSPPSRPHHPHIAMSDCIVNVTGGELPAKEIEAYKKRAVEKFGEMPRQIDIKVDGEEVELQYHLASEHFDRIRRITGYLVGTLDRFNDAKRAEERDRVKHATGCDCGHDHA